MTPAAGGPPPIFVVEDNPVDLDLMRHAFRRRRLSNPLTVARDGEEALGHLHRWGQGEEAEPAVVLLDIRLPRVDGLEVLKAIRAHPDCARIPVVMLTSSADDGDVRRAYEYGANSYIVKPVDFDKFMEVAEQIELYWCVLNQPPT
ncbi:response regulator [Thioalkalivibrio sp. ALJ24]|uniref:response regulator n=1 Tax=Thioalkalivibrio sp. ALJ24 TaxID=545276 RepID=UPI00036EBC81|nr:response regulator [Thioalkalivibrio sp. ALJ24]